MKFSATAAVLHRIVALAPQACLVCADAHECPTKANMQQVEASGRHTVWTCCKGVWHLAVSQQAAMESERATQDGSGCTGDTSAKTDVTD